MFRNHFKVAFRYLKSHTSFTIINILGLTLGFFCGSFVSTRLIARLGLTRLILIGRFISVFGLTAGLIAVLSGWISPISIFGATIFIGLVSLRITFMYKVCFASPLRSGVGCLSN